MSNRKLLVGLTLLAVLCGPVLARGQDAANGDYDELPTVTNLFLETDIRQALSDISVQTEVPILVGATVEGTITLQLDETPLPKALDMILAPGGYVWRQMDGYILVGPGDPTSPLFVGLSETRRVKLSNVGAEEALAMLSEPLRLYATADPQLNRITVTGPESVINRVMEDLEAIDSPARHVLLEARVVVLENTSLLDLGVEWDFPTVSTGTFNADSLNQTFPWVVQVGVTPGLQFTDALMLTLNLLEQNEEATIVSHPQLTVRDGRQAQMGVVTEEFFQIETQESIDLEVIPSGTTLSIQPTIGDDDKVTLLMDIEVSDVVGRGEEGLPIVTRRTAQSTVQVVSGGTAAISGLMESRTDVLSSRVPGAADVPLIGGGFRNEASTRSSQQIAVFITATVIEDPRPREPTREAAEAVDENVFRQQIQAVLDRRRAEKETTTP